MNYTQPITQHIVSPRWQTSVNTISSTPSPRHHLLDTISSTLLTIPTPIASDEKQVDRTHPHALKGI